MKKKITHANISRIKSLAQDLTGRNSSEDTAFETHKRNQLADLLARVSKEVRIFMGAKS